MEVPSVLSKTSIIELTQDSPTAEQPPNTNVNLRPHQLTLLYQCQKLETGEFDVDVKKTHGSMKNIACRIRTRVGIMADKVGAGKSNVILSLIATDKDALETARFTSTFTCGLDNIVVTIDQEKQACDVNILVIPHNLVTQWDMYIKHFFKTPIKYLMISKTKVLNNLTQDNIQDYKLIVVTSTFYPKLVNMFSSTPLRVKRTIFDEVDCVNITTCATIDSTFFWFVTASYQNLIHPRGHGRYDHNENRYVVVAEGLRSGGFLRNMFMSLNGPQASTLSRQITNLVIAKNKDSFVDFSISLPEIHYQYIKCKTPRTIQILNGIVDRQVIRYLNSGDIESAIHCINPSHRSSEDNIIAILLDKYKKSLHNLDNIINYVTNHLQYDNESQRESELQRLQLKKDDYTKKIESITTRIKESDSCCICYENMDDRNKTIVNCCMNAFCFKCISTWVYGQRHVCPLCKGQLDVEKMYVVSALPTDVIQREDDTSKEIHESNDKMQNLANLLRLLDTQYVNNKVLIFSMNGVSTIHDILTDIGRDYKMLKGTSAAVSNIIERYKNGDLNTLYINPEAYGSGLNLENTTDLIMLHKFDTGIEHQVIGRAQRYGRKTPLRVWYLLYENEMPH